MQLLSRPQAHTCGSARFCHATLACHDKVYIGGSLGSLVLKFGLWPRERFLFPPAKLCLQHYHVIFRCRCKLAWHLSKRMSVTNWAAYGSRLLEMLWQSSFCPLWRAHKLASAPEKQLSNWLVWIQAPFPWASLPAVGGMWPIMGGSC